MVSGVSGAPEGLLADFPPAATPLQKSSYRSAFVYFATVSSGTDLEQAGHGVWWRMVRSCVESRQDLPNSLELQSVEIDIHMQHCCICISWDFADSAYMLTLLSHCPLLPCFPCICWLLS